MISFLMQTHSEASEVTRSELVFIQDPLHVGISSDSLNFLMIMWDQLGESRRCLSFLLGANSIVGLSAYTLCHKALNITILLLKHMVFMRVPLLCFVTLSSQLASCLWNVPTRCFHLVPKTCSRHKVPYH